MELFKRKPATGYRFILLLFVSVAVMVMDQREQHIDRVRSALSAAAAPMQYAVSEPVSGWNWLRHTFTSYQSLVSDNGLLRQRNLELSAKVQTMQGLIAENERLRALLASAPKGEDKVAIANLLQVDTSPFVHMFTLAKGAHDHVYKGQAVMDENGMLGQVIRVGPTISQVLLLTDTRSAIPIEDTRNGVRSIAAGRGPDQPLALVDVPKTEGVKVGDVLVTSGLGERFPAGYPVGTVMSVVHNPGEHFATILVEPAADFNRSRLVLLIWPKTPPVNMGEMQKVQAQEVSPSQ